MSLEWSLRVGELSADGGLAVSLRRNRGWINGSANALATSGFSGKGADGGGAGGSEKCAFKSVFDLIGDGRDDFSEPDFVSFVGDSTFPPSMASILCLARARSCDCCMAYFNSACTGQHILTSRPV